MNNINPKKSYAKDPIDFIRNFTFATFEMNPGTTVGSTRSSKDLVIRINNDGFAGVVEVVIHHTNYRAAEYVASWLEKQRAFTIMPLAEVSYHVNSVMIQLSMLTAEETRMSMIKHQLSRLIEHIGVIDQQVKQGDCGILRPSYEQRPENQFNRNNAGMQPGQIIGHIVLDDSRTPIGGQSRLPQGSTAGNKNNW